LNGKERFDRVIVDKKIDSRERYMKRAAETLQPRHEGGRDDVDAPLR
jgi:hypothetical protein